MNASNLPFFYTLNDLCLTFEVDAAASKEKGSIKKLVFGVIRNKKELSKILCGLTRYWSYQDTTKGSTLLTQPPPTNTHFLVRSESSYAPTMALKGKYSNGARW